MQEKKKKKINWEHAFAAQKTSQTEKLHQEEVVIGSFYYGLPSCPIFFFFFLAFLTLLQRYFALDVCQDLY